METIKTDLVAFNGTGPYEYSETASSEVTVLHNPSSKNYIFFLSKEEYGPVIVETDFERGKEKFKSAFGKMLIFRSAMSVPDAREKFAQHLKNTYDVQSD